MNRIPDDPSVRLLPLDSAEETPHTLLPRAGALTAVISAALIGLAGCAPGSGPTVGSPSPTAVTSPASATPLPLPPPSTPSTAPAESQEPAVPADTNITITVNGTSVTGRLQNNAASASLLAQLPLELTFEDYGGQEKIADIPAPLSRDGMPTGGSAEPGTIGYYAPDQSLVLYYEAVGYFNGIIPIGTFDDVDTVRDAPAFVGTMTAN